MIKTCKPKIKPLVLITLSEEEIDHLRYVYEHNVAELQNELLAEPEDITLFYLEASK